MALNRSARRESQLTLTRRNPAAASSLATPASSMPLVVRAKSSNPSSLEPGDEARQTPSDERLAAGDADTGHAAPTRHPGQPGDLVEREQIVTRHGR